VVPTEGGADLHNIQCSQRQIVTRSQLVAEGRVLRARVHQFVAFGFDADRFITAEEMLQDVKLFLECRALLERVDANRPCLP
jgi:hypothetical protein